MASTKSGTQPVYPADGTGISKIALPHYLVNYEEAFADLDGTAFDLLELGVARGESLRFWADRYPMARITGIDVALPDVSFEDDRVAMYEGGQQDGDFLARVAAERAPGGFDVIVDDASHVGHLSQRAFNHLFYAHLKPGGFYVVEDWGTGYWPHYLDGRAYRPALRGRTRRDHLIDRLPFGDAEEGSFLARARGKAARTLIRRRNPSHDAGMVGFVKSLVDLVGLPDATDDRYGAAPKQASPIAWMRLSVGHAIIKKAEATGDEASTRQAALLSKGNE